MTASAEVCLSEISGILGMKLQVGFILFMEVKNHESRRWSRNAGTPEFSQSSHRLWKKMAPSMAAGLCSDKVKGPVYS